MISSDFFISSVILLAYVFNFSKVDITLSLSRIEPCTLLNASKSESSSYLNLTMYSPWIFIKLSLFSSTSALSFLKKMFRHWSYSEDEVIVKFTNVTREQRSGVNRALLFLVIMYMEKLGLKSIYWSPTRINTMPPVLYTSLLRTEFKIGSIFYTSCTINGLPNLRDFSKFFKKASSANDERIKLLSLINEVKYSMACPEGSMIKGYLWYLFMIMAFSVHRSSEGSLWDLHINLSLGEDRNSIIASSSLNFIFFDCNMFFHTPTNNFL